MASEGDEDKPKQKVTVATSTHTLYYAPDLPDVGDMTKVTTEEVPAWTVESDRGVRVKVMRKGGNLVELSKDGHPSLGLQYSATGRVNVTGLTTETEHV